MNKGDSEFVFSIEVEFPLTSDQPGILNINTRKLARDSEQNVRVRVTLVLAN